MIHQPLKASAIEDRYLAIKEHVWRAAEAKGRDPASVKIVAVTKTFEAEHILPVLGQGHRFFGENRVQEAMKKWPPLRERFPDIELHLIGPLQSNKAREAVRFFDWIHTLDRPKLAAALASEIEKLKQSPRLLIQVNTGLEPQKAGVAPDAAETLIAECRETYDLAIEGFMCIPPVQENPVPHFEMLAALRDRTGLTELSMGMSDDFELAIAHGATIIRVGSAIFGSR